MASEGWLDDGTYHDPEHGHHDEVDFAHEPDLDRISLLSRTGIVDIGAVVLLILLHRLEMVELGVPLLILDVGHGGCCSVWNGSDLVKGFH